MAARKAAESTIESAPKDSDAAEYSIRIVASETGIPADTLRMWERRYGFPKPSRRPGGARLYRIDDVARLRLIARARDAGFRPGDVIALSDRDVTRLLANANALATTTTSTSSSSHIGSSELLEMIRSDDVSGARSTMRSLAVNLGPKAFVTDVAHPLAILVGNAWETGSIDIRHEHLASSLLSMQLRLMLSTFDVDGGGGAGNTTALPLVLLTTLPGEAHALGLDMIAVYLAATHRAAPRLLGPDMPPKEIARAAHAMNAKAVGISVSTAHDAGTMKRYVTELRHSLAPIELWIGGAGAPFVAEGNVKVMTTWGAIDEGVIVL